MECGQYNENWHAIHMYPEECVQAAQDGKAKTVMAVHWGAFALAQHHWKDPIERFFAEASKRQMNCKSPEIGQCFSVNDELSHCWWNDLE